MNHRNSQYLLTVCLAYVLVSCDGGQSANERTNAKVLNGGDATSSEAKPISKATKDNTKTNPSAEDGQGESETSSGAGGTIPPCVDKPECDIAAVASTKMIDFDAQYRSAILQNNGDLWILKNGLALAGSDKNSSNAPIIKDYVLAGQGVVNFQVDANYIAIKTNKNAIMVKSGGAGSWKTIAENVQSFQISGQWLIMLDNKGILWSADLLNGQVVQQGEKIVSFSTKSNMLAAINSAGALYVKTNFLSSQWSMASANAKVIKAMVGGSKLVALLENGNLHATSLIPTDGVATQLGNAIATGIQDFVISENYIAALTKSSDVYLKIGIFGEWVKESFSAKNIASIYLTEAMIAAKTADKKLSARVFAEGRDWKLHGEQVEAAHVNKNYISMVNSKGEAYAKQASSAWWEAKSLTTDNPPVKSPASCTNGALVPNPFEPNCSMANVIQAEMHSLQGQPRSIVLFKGGDLYGMKDGGQLTSYAAYDKLADGITSFQVNNNRIAVNNVANDVYIKNGIYGAWVKVGGGVKSYRLTSQWLIMLDTNGGLWSIDLRTNAAGPIGSNVTQFSANDYMVAAITTDNKLYVKTEALNDTFSVIQLGEPVSKLLVKGSKLGLLTSLGNLFVTYDRPRKGAAFSIGARIAEGITDFDMSYKYIAALSANGQTYVKYTYAGAWVAEGGVGSYSNVYVSDDYLAVRGHDKTVYAREITFNNPWVKLSTRAETFAISSRFVSVISPESYLYQKEFLSTEWWTSLAPPTGLAFHSMRNFGKMMGTATNAYAVTDPKVIPILLQNYNSLTPENEMKFSYTEPARGVFTLDPARPILEFARYWDMKVHGHVLIWHHDSQIPAWVRAYENNPTELANILYAHVRGVVTMLSREYGDRLESIDVVNEAIDDYNGGLRNSIWKKIGNGSNDYIKIAFLAARDANPNLKLYYNDYLAEGYNLKGNQVFGMLADLKGIGIPIDGVGLQMHRSPYWPFQQSDIDGNMWRLANLGLDIHISEMDYSVSDSQPANSGEFGNQAWFFYQVTQACMIKNAKCNRVSVWGPSDRFSWIPWVQQGYGRGLPFDANEQPKPGYWGMLNATKGL